MGKNRRKTAGRLVEYQDAEVVLTELEVHALAYAAASKSDNTKRTYDALWKPFLAWCQKQEVAALPASPDDVAKYITKLARDGRKAAGIDTALTAISQAHLLNGYESPRYDHRVRSVLAGIRREIGVKQRHVEPLTVEHIKKVIDALPKENEALFLRDRALLLLGFVGAFPRSQLVALNYGDLELVDEGILVKVRRSQTDQERVGRKVAIPLSSDKKYCPVIALNEWLRFTEIKRSAIFRAVDQWGTIKATRLSRKGAALAVKRSVMRVGMSEKNVAAHSLRAGFMEAAAAAGKAERAIMEHTGHRTSLIVRRHIRNADPWRNNAAEGLL